MNYETQIEFEGEEIEVRVDFDFEPPEKGNMSGPPDSWSPSFDGNAPINSVVWDGLDITGELSDELLDELSTEMYERYCQEMSDREEAEADRAADEKMERMRDNRLDWRRDS